MYGLDSSRCLSPRQLRSTSFISIIKNIYQNMSAEHVQLGSKQTDLPQPRNGKGQKLQLFLVC